MYYIYMSRYIVIFYAIYYFRLIHPISFNFQLQFLLYYLYVIYWILCSVYYILYSILYLITIVNIIAKINVFKY